MVDSGVSIHWRGAFSNPEIHALHAAAFQTRLYDATEWDWVAQVERYSLGWVVAREGEKLIGFANVLWDGHPSGNLTTYLKQLATEDRGLLVRRNLDGRYSFSEPLLHTYARLTLLGGQFTDSSDIYLPDLQRVTITIDGARMDFHMPRAVKATSTTQADE